MSSNYETAKQIIQIIGKENITFMTHCATRLRFNVVDDGKVDLDALDQVEGVIKAQNRVDSYKLLSVPRLLKSLMRQKSL